MELSLSAVVRHRERLLELESLPRLVARRPSQGSPGPLILICGVGGGGTPSMLFFARLHFSTGIRLSPYEVRLAESQARQDTPQR